MEEREIGLKELAHTVVEAGKSKICRWASGLETQEGGAVQAQRQLTELLLAQGRSAFFSIKAFY